MKRLLKRIGIFTLALSTIIPLAIGDVSPVYAEEESTVKVDKDGYNLLGSIVSLSQDGNKIDLEVSSKEKIRFTFLNENVFRLYMAPEGETFQEYPTPNSASHEVTMTNKSDSEYEQEYQITPSVVETGDAYKLSTDAITIEINKETAMMKLSKNDGSVVWEEAAPLRYKTGSTIQTLKTDENEYFYGGGTQNGRFSHKGEVIQVAKTNSWVDKGVTSPNPFYWSTDGYGVVRNTWKPGNYDFDANRDGVIETTHDEKRFDAYYFVDDTAKDLLSDYYELTGKPVQLPEYASYLGHLNCYNRDYWKEVSEGTSGAEKIGSKWYVESSTDNGGVKETLLGADGPTAQQVLDDHKTNDMPLGWFVPNDGYGCGYGQTTTQVGDIENYKDFSSYANERGIESGLWTQSNLWPADANNPQKGERDVYKEVDAGLRAVKTDVAWVGAGYSMALNGVSVAYDAITSRSGTKANIVSLNGWAGTQRYAGIWSGDQSGGQWEYIRFHIPTYIGTGLSGQPNIGSDMDGIFGGNNKIVNIRDFQWKAFTTYMLDMDGWGSNQKTPWALGEDATSINRAYLKLKAELMPYINTMSYEATKQGGLPMLRAMFLEEENAFTLGKDTQYQYMWGDSLLVAPVYQNTKADASGNDVRNGIYLPGTSDVWIDYFTGEQYRGGQVLNNFDAPIWKLPVFVKNGAILPRYPENNNPSAITDKNPDGLDRSQRIVEFYPHEDSEFDLYEDDGLTLDGASALTHITSHVEDETATLTVEKTSGSYAGMEKNRSTEFIVNVSKEPVSLSGKVAGSDVTFTKVTSQEAYDNASGNVYFYNENPNIFVKEYASEGSKYANTTETRRPQLFVKSTVKNDITANDFVVVVEGFTNEQTLAKDELNPSLAVPANLVEVSKTDSQISVAWDSVSDATSYDIEVDGNVYKNILDTTYLHEGLDFLSDHTYRVRAVNDEGYSSWSEIIQIQTSDDPYRNVPTVNATWAYGEQWGALKNAFDHDRNTMFHSTNAVTPDQMMVLDLGDAYQLDKFTYQPRMDNKGNGAVQRMDVYVSLDGVNYTKAWDGASETAWTYNKADMEVDDIKTVDLSGVKARYVKLSVLASTGGFFSASELTVYKQDGTSAWEVGDVNNSGALETGDLTFYENYMGLKPVDSDWEYSSLGNIDNNDIIDAYDISFVARMLGQPITDMSTGVSGKIQIIPDKTDIKAGDSVTLQVYGLALENVNAFSIELPVDNSLYTITNPGNPSPSTALMRNFSKVRDHSDGASDDYFSFVNVGSQSLLNGTMSLGTITLKAVNDFTWDSNLTRALLVGQDLSTTDALIDETVVPEIPETETILKSSDIASITFDNAVMQDNDGSTLWQQATWRDILFNGDTSSALAEFKWKLANADIAAEVMLPTDMNFTFKEAQPLKTVKVYNRASGNGRVTSIKAVGYAGETAYDLGTYDSAATIFEFNVPSNVLIDKVVLTPMTSTGNATGTTTGSVGNRMLSWYEIEFIADTAVPATSIAFDDTSDSEVYISKLASVSAKVGPSNASNPFYMVTSSDESIAKVVQIPTATGYEYAIQGVSEGSVTLTASSMENPAITDTMEFTVIDGLDKTALEALLETSLLVNENLYTEASYQGLATAIKEAQTQLVNAKEQTAIDQAMMALKIANAGLVEKGSDSSLPSSDNLISKEAMQVISATSSAGESPKENILDDDIETIWHSNYNGSYTLPQGVVIDLGSEYDLEQVNYMPRQGSVNGHITKYQLEVSVDGVNFTPVVYGSFESDGTSLLAPQTAKEIKFASQTARYVRFTAIEALGGEKNKYASIAEMDFFGTPITPIDATNVYFESDTLDMVIGDLENANVVVEPLGATNTLSFTSSDENVATVDSQGRIFAVGEGSATIRVNVNALTRAVLSAEMTVNVANPTIEDLVSLLDEAKALLAQEEDAVDKVNALNDNLQMMIDEAQQIVDNTVVSNEEIQDAILSLRNAMTLFDKKASINAMEELLVLDMSVYSEDSTDAFKAAKTKAEEVLADVVNNIDAVDSAYKEFAAAYNTLVKLDATSLQAMIDEAEALSIDGYVDGTIKENFINALENAKNALVEGKTNTAYETAMNDLATAIVELVDATRASTDQYSQIQSYIEQLELALKENEYIDENKAIIEQALQSAKEAYANKNLTQKEAEDLLGELNLVMNTTVKDIYEQPETPTDPIDPVDPVDPVDPAKPIDPVKPTPPTEGHPSIAGTGIENGVEAGDSTNIQCVIGLFVIAGVVMLGMMKHGKHNQ